VTFKISEKFFSASIGVESSLKVFQNVLDQEPGADCVPAFAGLQWRGVEPRTAKPGSEACHTWKGKPQNLENDLYFVSGKFFSPKFLSFHQSKGL